MELHQYTLYFNSDSGIICTLLVDVEKLNYPVFTCPVRNLTTRITVDGVEMNNIESSDLATYIWEGLCPVDEDDDNSALDPSKNCDKTEKRFPFYECKNNCPGGLFNTTYTLQLFSFIYIGIYIFHIFNFSKLSNCCYRSSIDLWWCSCRNICYSKCPWSWSCW